MLLSPEWLSHFEDGLANKTSLAPFCMWLPWTLLSFCLPLWDDTPRSPSIRCCHHGFRFPELYNYVSSKFLDFVTYLVGSIRMTQSRLRHSPTFHQWIYRRESQWSTKGDEDGWKSGSVAKSIYCSCGGFALHVPMSKSSQRFVTSAPWALTRSSGLQGATAFQGTIPNCRDYGHAPHTWQK